MEIMRLSVNEPFISPAWESNFVVFSNESPDAVPPDKVKDYIAKSCRYAHKYGVYLVPERFILSGYHSLCLISPDGKVLGAQKGTHHNKRLSTPRRSNSMEIFHTPFGAIFLCVDVDIYQPEVPRLAYAMGARYIITSQSMQRGDYDTNMVLLGVWSASQGSNVYTIGVSGQFNCICAPRAMTDNNDGFLLSPRVKMPLTAKLDVDDLESVPQRMPLSRRLYTIHREELIPK